MFLLNLKVQTFDAKYLKSKTIIISVMYHLFDVSSVVQRFGSLFLKFCHCIIQLHEYELCKLFQLTVHLLIRMSSEAGLSVPFLDLRRLDQLMHTEWFPSFLSVPEYLMKGAYQSSDIPLLTVDPLHHLR